MKSILLAVIFSICCAVSASAASLDELTPFLSGQHLVWEEFSDGRRLLKESGQLLSGGIVIGAGTEFSMTLRGKAEIFGGVVDYDGETQAPDPVPVRTQVNYFGFRNQFDLGYRVTSGTLGIEPFGGVGHRFWLRDLESSTSSTGRRVSGYTELWQTGYGRLGARGRYLAPAGVSIFAEGGAMHPFYTGNTVDFVGSGTTTFRPRGKWSGFAETGATWRQLKVALFYEGFRWSKSPEKPVGDKRFFQPESSSDLLGMSLGWAFR
ncbi:MAG: hypothetical protein A2075_24295 [Geobacteraceae bacterium GWC2_58_44]|nr:MAG: hypothetical protein A2075_24295 [Geobacteraceae bacterium GWC2_58_44]